MRDEYSPGQWLSLSQKVIEQEVEAEPSTSSSGFPNPDTEREKGKEEYKGIKVKEEIRELEGWKEEATAAEKEHSWSAWRNRTGCSWSPHSFLDQPPSFYYSFLLLFFFLTAFFIALPYELLSIPSAILLSLPLPPRLHI